MKEQQIYDYVVTETIKSKDDNGQIDSKKLKILGSGQIPAFDEANAKLKAHAETTLPEGTDIDEVVVTARRFQG